MPEIALRPETAQWALWLIGLVIILASLALITTPRNR